MSVHVSSRVWKDSKQSGTALLLLVALADMANDEGVCWPKVPTLAARCRTTERNIQKLLRKLEEAGEILVHAKPGKQNVYKVLTGTTVDDAKTAPTDPVLPAQKPCEGVNPRSPHPRPTVHPTGEPQFTPPPNVGSPPYRTVIEPSRETTDDTTIKRTKVSASPTSVVVSPSLSQNKQATETKAERIARFVADTLAKYPEWKPHLEALVAEKQPVSLLAYEAGTLQNWLNDDGTPTPGSKPGQARGQPRRGRSRPTDAEINARIDETFADLEQNGATF